MKRARNKFWRRLWIGALTLPLLTMSCVDIAQRALINGFFDATAPLLNEHREECLMEAWPRAADAEH
jgi:hypothetical protein